MKTSLNIKMALQLNSLQIGIICNAFIFFINYILIRIEQTLQKLKIILRTSLTKKQ